MSHPLLGRRLLILTAHPDDEAFLCAGTAWQNAKVGGSNTLICATLGEKGVSHLSRQVTKPEIKRIRRRELMAGSAAAKIHPVHFLHMPDGELPEFQKKCWPKVKSLAGKLRPEAILTFGPDGITGHRCHIACWHIGRRLAAQLNIPLFVFTLPASIAKRAPAWFMRRRVNPHYHPIAPYRRPTVRVPTPRGFKVAMLRHYRSQFDFDNPYRGYPAYAAKVFTAAEHFARVPVSKSRL